MQSGRISLPRGDTSGDDRNVSGSRHPTRRPGKRLHAGAVRQPRGKVI